MGGRGAKSGGSSGSVPAAAQSAGSPESQTTLKSGSTYTDTDVNMAKNEATSAVKKLNNSGANEAIRQEAKTRAAIYSKEAESKISERDGGIGSRNQNEVLVQTYKALTRAANEVESEYKLGYIGETLLNPNTKKFDHNRKKRVADW
jgi:hypothetical protein